jgi:hypothetical protein
MYKEYILKGFKRNIYIYNINIKSSGFGVVVGGDLSDWGLTN